MNYKFPWKPIKEYKEIVFHKFEGIARISINRPHVHNAFTPVTINEMIDAMYLCREDKEVGVIIITGEGDKAFCSGGDQSVRGHGGYIGRDRKPRLIVLDLHKIIRSIPATVIAAVAGWPIVGEHDVHVVCDLTIAAENARFRRTVLNAGSFHGDLGASELLLIVVQKKAMEI